MDEVLRILNVYVEGKMICRSEGARNVKYFKITLILSVIVLVKVVPIAFRNHGTGE